MGTEDPLLPPPPKHVPLISSSSRKERSLTGVVATKDHDLIREWATQHAAEPATGQATPSGAATSLDVHDGGVGIRFNFPGTSRLRPIAWEEWFEHFDRYELLFVYEEPMSRAGAAYRIVRAADFPGIIG